MNKNNEIDNGVAAIPYQIKQRHLGVIGSDATIDDVELSALDFGGDYALELRGKTLYIFRVQVREVPEKAGPPPETYRMGIQV